MTDNRPSKTVRDWRAGCECNRVGLCFRCQTADEIERLQAENVQIEKNADANADELARLRAVVDALIPDAQLDKLQDRLSERGRSGDRTGDLCDEAWGAIIELRKRLANEPPVALNEHPECRDLAHSELMRRLPNVPPHLLAEIQKLSPWALQRRVLIQADWLGSYSRCLDGLGLKEGVDTCWNPRDIRRAVENLRPSVPPSVDLDRLRAIAFDDSLNTWEIVVALKDALRLPETKDAGQ